MMDLKLLHFKILGMIHPQFLLRGDFRAPFIDGIVSITSRSITLDLECKEAVELENGTPMILWINQNGYFVGCPEAEYLEWQKAKQDEKDKKEANEKLHENEENIAAAKFNDWLRSGLPFVWYPAIKDVLSGLSEKSDGSGRNRRTVIHIALNEDVHLGRLKRGRHDFLCCGGNKGKQWSGQAREKLDDFESKITCRTCLKIAERFTKGLAKK